MKGGFDIMPDIISIQIPYTLMGEGGVSGIGDIIGGFDATNVLIVTDSGIVKGGLLDKIISPLQNIGCKFDVFDECQANAPSHVIEECSKRVREGGYDLLIGVGGGSVLDTAKIVSVVASSGMKVQDLLISGKGKGKVLPKILVPTTSGTGSEWSEIGMFTDETDGQKKALRINQFYPNATIVDPEMTLNLPQRITADTGMDALSHAIEGYVSVRSNIVSDMFAEAALRLIPENLRLAYAKGHRHMEARRKLAIASSLAMEAGVICGVGLAHYLDGFIVTRAHISHGAALSILLPHVMEFHLVAAPTKFAKIAALMGEKIEGLSVMDAARKSVDAVRRLIQDLGMTQRLRDVGINDKDIPQIVDDLFMYMLPVIERNNPRLVSREDVTRVLRAAL
jgi:alcohol dehydrogenase class IV